MPQPRDAHDRLEVASRALAYADALHDLAWYLARSEVEAEDLVQETYVRALAAADQLETGANLKAWLFRILRNLFLSRVRHARHDPTEGGLDTVAPHAVPQPDDSLRGDAELEAMRGIVGAEIEAALCALGEDARTAVLLDLEGFSEAEMASILGCAPGTVKSRLSRARAALRERLREYARTERP
ncbi:MAG TPA: sigma-70 family RNA polymerase sigma factor [Anaeromyxobacter sp.]